MAAVFNEWARRYAENPEEWLSTLDPDGKPWPTYGDDCAAYFRELECELAAAGKLPRFDNPPPHDDTHGILSGAAP